MRRETTRPLARPFPQGRQNTWQQQQLFMKLSNARQEEREPFRFGAARTLYGKAKYSSI